MATIGIDEVEGRTARDVIHPRMSASDADAPIGELRAWFAGSTSRRLAVLVDADGRFAGTTAAPPWPRTARRLARYPSARDIDPGREHAARRATSALAAASRRVPVVEADGRLVGVVALDKNLTCFCGTSAPV